MILRFITGIGNNVLGTAGIFFFFLFPFDQDKEWVWLGTAPGTRAENFYKSQGWTQKGLHQNGELRFEMTNEEWQKFLDTE